MLQLLKLSTNLTDWFACVGKPPGLQPGAGYLWVPKPEYRWTPRYPTYKYLKVINQVHRLLNKICSIFLFDNGTFQNEKPGSKFRILGFLRDLHRAPVAKQEAAFFSASSLHRERPMLIPALTLQLYPHPLISPSDLAWLSPKAWCSPPTPRRMGPGSGLEPLGQGIWGILGIQSVV